MKNEKGVCFRVREWSLGLVWALLISYADGFTWENSTFVSAELNCVDPIRNRKQKGMANFIPTLHEAQ
jgi:hypothetical protein